MATCFLFTTRFDENNCLSLKLTAEGQVEAPLAIRTLADFKSLQNNARTWVIIPSTQAGIHEVELPWLGDRKARAAIPYALEEDVAQNVSGLHFVFDKAHYQHNRYLVAVIDKLLFSEVVNKLLAYQIEFNLITLDWFALREGEICLTRDYLLANTSSYKGALPLNLVSYYFEKMQDKEADKLSEIYIFDDTPQESITLIPDRKPDKLTEDSYTWVAKRIASLKPMDFSQGEFQRESRKSKNKLFYYLAATAGGLWLITVLLTNIIHIHTLKKEHEKLDNQIATIYYQFFPEAKQVISPKFRISNLLEKGKNEIEAFWELLSLFTSNYNVNLFTLEQIRFQNNVLSVTLLSKTFAELEALQTRLKDAGLKVTQTQASSQEQQVLATLDFSL